MADGACPEEEVGQLVKIESKDAILPFQNLECGFVYGLLCIEVFEIAVSYVIN